MTIYFSYGANMDPVHMAESCPGAECLGPATLHHHAFGIAVGGFGTVRPDPDNSVPGVLWRLTDADLAALDRFEGVAEDFYRRHHLSVHRQGWANIDAIVYLPVDDRPGRPNPGYLERIIEVGEAGRFTEHYLRWLRGLLATPS